MRLEGTLDAFGLPDILALLAMTRKTGALRLSSPPAAGVVRVHEGAICGASSDTTRQVLARRVVGAGLVGDDALASAVGRADGGRGVVGTLLADGALAEEVLLPLAAEQATDAVGELLRWPSGEFSFVVDDADPDALPLQLPVADVVAEGQRRLAVWDELSALIPSTDVALALAVAPGADAGDELRCSREEWGLLALVDGTRTVAEIVTLLGRSEFAVVRALAALVSRGLLVVPGHGAADGGGGFAELARRQALLAGLESSAPTSGVGDAVVPTPRPAPAVPTSAPVPPAIPVPAPPVSMPPSPPVPAQPAPAPVAPPSVPVPSAHATAGANALALESPHPVNPPHPAAAAAPPAQENGRPALTLHGGVEDASVHRSLVVRFGPLPATG